MIFRLTPPGWALLTSGWAASTKAADGCGHASGQHRLAAYRSADILLTRPQTLPARRKVTACPSIRLTGLLRPARTGRVDHAGMNNKPGSVRDLIGDYIAEQCTVIIDSEAAAACR